MCHKYLWPTLLMLSMLLAIGINGQQPASSPTSTHITTENLLTTTTIENYSTTEQPYLNFTCDTTADCRVRFGNGSVCHRGSTCRCRIAFRWHHNRCAWNRCLRDSDCRPGAIGSFGGNHSNYSFDDTEPDLVNPNYECNAVRAVCGCNPDLAVPDRYGIRCVPASYLGLAIGLSVALMVLTLMIGFFMTTALVVCLVCGWGLWNANLGGGGSASGTTDTTPATTTANQLIPEVVIQDKPDLSAAARRLGVMLGPGDAAQLETAEARATAGLSPRKSCVEPSRKSDKSAAAAVVAAPKSRVVQVVIDREALGQVADRVMSGRKRSVVKIATPKSGAAPASGAKSQAKAASKVGKQTSVTGNAGTAATGTVAKKGKKTVRSVASTSGAGGKGQPKK